MDDVPWLTDREQQAWRALQFMHLQLDARMAQELAERSTLSYADYVVLVVLTDQPDGRMRAREVARELGWEQSRLSHHVARMVQRGLVTKEACADDRRGFDLQATDHGHACMAAAAPSHVETVRHYVIDRLTPAQLDTLTEVAATVLDALAE